MQILADTMEEFSGCSGLQINKEKSHLFAGGIHGNLLHEVREVFGFPIGSLPIKYLGVPLASMKLNAMHYSPLIEKIAAFTNKWSGKNLSFAGRLQLIRSVLQGVECYWLQVFPLPGNVIDRIVSIARIFLWGSKQSPVAWKDCCLPFEEGGLGLRNLNAWNVALLTKVLWNIHSKSDSLWIKWIHSEYIKQGELWDWVAQKKDSPLIKNILSIRDRMLLNLDRSGAIQLWEQWFRDRGTVEAYEWFRPKGERKFWPKFIWKSFIPPKFSFITWRAIKGRLPTRDRLSFLNINPQCPLCLQQDESTEHLFFKCQKTLIVWNDIKRWLGLRRLLSTIPSAIKWMNREKMGSAIINKAKRVALAATVSMVWRARNAFVFNNLPFDSNHVTIKIKRAVYAVLFSLFPPEAVTAHLGI